MEFKNASKYYEQIKQQYYLLIGSPIILSILIAFANLLFLYRLLSQSNKSLKSSDGIGLQNLPYLYNLNILRKKFEKHLNYSKTIYSSLKTVKNMFLKIRANESKLIMSAILKCTYYQTKLKQNRMYPIQLGQYKKLFIQISISQSLQLLAQLYHKISFLQQKQNIKMSQQLLELENNNQPTQNKPLTEKQLNTLFKKPLVKQNNFNLDDLIGNYTDHPEFKRLNMHLKKWNLSVTKKQKTNQKELDLYNHLFNMLRCIKHQQNTIQQDNLRKLEDWFLRNNQKIKKVQAQIKHQNLDLLEKDKPFRNKEASQLLKHYSKPYQICLKLFQQQKKHKKTKFQQENESIQRCDRRRIKKQAKLIQQEREQKEVQNALQQFRVSQAKRRMVSQKIKLSNKISFENNYLSETNYKTTSFSKYSGSIYYDKINKIQSKQQVKKIRKMNKTLIDKFYTEVVSNLNQSAKSMMASSQDEVLQLRKNMSFNSGKRSSVSTAVGYRLMINPFLNGELKKKKR